MSIIGSVLAIGTTVCALGIEEAWFDFPFGDGSEGVDAGEVVDMGLLTKEKAIDPTSSAVEGIQAELGIAYADDQRATFYAQLVINRFLAIVWLISLIVLLFWFYKMFVAKDNAEAFQEALKIVKGAVLALVIIGVSRYIVSFLFALFFEAKQDIN